MTPAETIRNRRIEAGLTQAALAAALKIASTRISDWERGVYTPNPASAQGLANVLGGSPLDYLGLGGAACSQKR